jgi:mycoredoxin
MQPMHVIVYSAVWCRDCREAKRFLEEHQIAYTEIDIERVAGAADEVLRNVGKRAIPQFVIDGRWVQPYRPGRGFLYQEMSELLGVVVSAAFETSLHGRHVLIGRPRIVQDRARVVLFCSADLQQHAIQPIAIQQAGVFTGEEAADARRIQPSLGHLCLQHVPEPLDRHHLLARLFV